MASTYLVRTQTAGTNTKGTWSAWIKRGKITAEQNLFRTQDGAEYTQIAFMGSDVLMISTLNGGTDISFNAYNKFRDVGAWYNFVVAFDSTQVTATDRVKLYINGVQIPDADLDNNTYPDKDAALPFNNASMLNSIGSTTTGSGGFFDGVMAHVHWTDGTAYAASDFGSFDATSGNWIPNTGPSVTYGTNGFFLKFASGALGTDSSGEGNTMTVTGTMTNTKDTPQNNFCTINPLDNYYQTSTFANGNNKITMGGGYPFNTGTMGLSTGKWYWELLLKDKGTNDYQLFGITGDACTSSTNWLGTNLYGWGLFNDETNLKNNNTSVGGYTGVGYTTGDYLGVAVDLDNLKLYFHKNGTWVNSGVPTSGATGTGAASITAPASTTFGCYLPALGQLSVMATEWETNFGNGYFGTTSHGETNADDAGIGLFKYDVPAGYYAICTNNLGDQS